MHRPVVADVAVALMAATAVTCTGASPAGTTATARVSYSTPVGTLAVARSAIVPRVSCASLTTVDLTGV